MPIRPNDPCGPLRALPRRLALVAGAVAGLASGASAQQAPGQFDSLLESLQLKAKVKPAPAFVTRSRPQKEGDFIPVGTTHPAHPVKVMTPAEVAAAEADLDGTRERQQRRAGQKPAVVPLKPFKATGVKNTVR